MSSSDTETKPAATAEKDIAKLEEEAERTSLNLESIVEGENERGVPAVKFIDDVGAFSEQFTPPASPELLIGAFSDIFGKFKALEANLSQKSVNFIEKIPEIEKSLAIVLNLKKKQDEEETLVARYSLADTVFGKAEIDTSAGVVGLWLGANVMLEYTYDDAIALLTSKEENAKREFEEVSRYSVVLSSFFYTGLLTGANVIVCC